MTDLDGENWDSGVFGHGEFNYDISFLFRATGGLQTGSKMFEKCKYGRNAVKIGTQGFSNMESSNISLI
jgi:hypothetical protein